MKTRFTSDDVWNRYDSNLNRATRALRDLPVFCGTKPTIRGLSGWVFEQVVQHCLAKELRSRGIAVEIVEQATLGGRAKADLKVGRALLEVKLSGCYGRESYEKYVAYRRNANAAGFRYLYLSGEEIYKPYRQLARDIFGSTNTFFLAPKDDWPRFVERVVQLL